MKSRSCDQLWPSLALVLLLAPLSCRPAASGAHFATAVADTLAAAPEFAYRVVDLDDASTRLEVKLLSKPGTEVGCAEILSMTLGGVAPVEALPLTLGPVFGGEVASQVLEFRGVRWEEDLRNRGSDAEPNPFQALFTYAMTLSHAPTGSEDPSVQRASSSTSRSNLSMPIWIDASSPLHARLAARAGSRR